MNVATEDFLNNFHSLTGETIGERRKNLFRLLKTTLKSEEIDFSSIQPKTPLEENFKVEALIYFKRVPDLLEVLKSGHPILIHKVLNSSSWFMEAFVEMSGDDLATQIFPHLSYNTKLKLLHRLSSRLKLNPWKADGFFEAIWTSYGLHLASQLLPACSSDRILTCAESRVEITARQLLVIIKRHPGLTEDLFERLNLHPAKLDLCTKYHSAFVYLAQHDLPLFIRLMDKYKPKIKLGARATDSLIGKARRAIVENPKKFYEMLKTKRLGAKMRGDDFNEFFRNVFPSSMDSLEGLLEVYLTLVLRHVRSDAEKLRLLTETFKAVHGTELWDEVIFASSLKLIGMMTPDEREVWMRGRSRPAEVKEAEWISFMRTDVSVPLLKEKMASASDFNERAKLVNCLVTTCKLNGDNVALLDVCQHMLNKHRNDHPNVRYEFYRALVNLCDLTKLGDEHWTCLLELIQISRLNGERFWNCSAIFQQYIESCWENNLPIVDLLLEWTKMEQGIFLICPNKPSCEKKCLLMFNDLFPDAYDEEEVLEARYLQYLIALRTWNRRHPKDKISLFINPDAIRCLKSHLENEEFAYAEEETIAECILTDYKKSQEFDLLPGCLNRKYYYQGFARVVHFLIKHHPSVLLEHVKKDNIIKMFHQFRSSKNLYRYYTHLGLPQKISELCLNVLINQDQTPEMKKACAIALSHTMHVSDFLNLSPLSDLAIDIKTSQGQHTYKIQKELLYNIKNVVPPFLALETILDFSKGNYVGLARRPLYSVVHGVAEDKLVQFFRNLNDLAVSVRKHAIFLAFKVLNKSAVFEMLRQIGDAEKNPSIRKSLFKAIFNFFLRNPDDYSWELVTRSGRLVDVKTLMKYERVPPVYFSRYVSFTWEALEAFTKPNQSEEGKCRFLEAMSETTIAKIPKDLCETIMQKYLFKPKKLTNLAKKTHAFVSTYLIFHNNSQPEQDQRMNSVFLILKDYIQTTWYNLSTMAVARQMVTDFVHQFCDNFITKTCLERNVLVAFINSWNDLLKPHEDLHDFLYLNFTLMYVDSLNQASTMEQIGSDLALFCDYLYDQSSLDMDIFRQSFDSFKSFLLAIDEHGDKDLNELVLIESVVKATTTSSGLVLALCLLPNSEFMSTKMKVKRDAVLDAALKDPHKSVQIRLHHYLRLQE